MWSFHATEVERETTQIEFGFDFEQGQRQRWALVCLAEKPALWLNRVEVAPTLTPGDSQTDVSDGLKSALRDLPEDQIKQALVEHGIAFGDNAAANIDLLAIALVVKM